MDTPCHNCEDRHELCHADCMRYLNFKLELEKAREAKSDEMGLWHTHWNHKLSGPLSMSFWKPSTHGKPTKRNVQR